MSPPPLSLLFPLLLLSLPSQSLSLQSHSLNTTHLFYLLDSLSNHHFPPPRPSSPPITNVAYLKTHKTGSGTLYQLFHLIGMKRGATFAPKNKQFWLDGYERKGRRWGEKEEAGGGGGGGGGRGCVNMGLNHFMPLRRGKMRPVREHGRDGLWFEKVVESTYNKNLCPPYFLLSSFRSPITHHPSVRHYFGITPDNPLSSDFVLNNFTQIDNFTTNYLTSKKLFPIILEKFEKGLVLLRHILNWDLTDILYIEGKANKRWKRERKEGGKEEGGLEEGKYEIDEYLYGEAETAFEGWWEELVGEVGREALEEELETLSFFQTSVLPSLCPLLNSYCSSSPPSECFFKSPSHTFEKKRREGGGKGGEGKGEKERQVGWWWLVCKVGKWGEEGIQSYGDLGPPFHFPHPFSPSLSSRVLSFHSSTEGRGGEESGEKK